MPLLTNEELWIVIEALDHVIDNEVFFKDEDHDLAIIAKKKLDNLHASRLKETTPEILTLRKEIAELEQQWDSLDGKGLEVNQHAVETELSIKRAALEAALRKG